MFYLYIIDLKSLSVMHASIIIDISRSSIPQFSNKIRFINVNLDSSEILLFNSQSIIDLYSTFLQKTIKNEGNEG